MRNTSKALIKKSPLLGEDPGCACRIWFKMPHSEDLYVAKHAFSSPKIGAQINFKCKTVLL